jgi:hypothetical protein
MSSSSKRQQTRAKMDRERTVKEKRERKQAKKDEKKQAATPASEQDPDTELLPKLE